MTRTLTVDSNNDIFIGNDGSLSVSSDLQAVLYACAAAAKTQLGEMVLAVDEGMPNFEAVWVGSPNLAQFEAYLRRTLTSVIDVTGVSDLTITRAGGVLSYQVTIQTIYGSGVING